jgi:hypothetical protein
MVLTMNEQLLLVCGSPEEPPWRLDDHTREVGRRGLQEAREALRRTAAAERSRTTRRTAA